MRTTIIGAGRMGAGIARACAAAGHEVTLIDHDRAATHAAVERVRSSLDRGGDPEAAQRIRPGEGDIEADLVIEAVFEDLETKRELLRRISPGLARDTLIATNTSSYPVEHLASACDHPGRLVAMHFFYPAHKNRLLEVAGGPETSEDMVERAVLIGRGLGKTVIRTADSPGFAVNRFLLRWAGEAARMVDEGMDPATVEASGAASVDLPYGPLALIDMSGTTVCLHATETLAEAFGDAYAPAKCLQERGGAGEAFDVRAGEPDEAMATRIRDAMLDAVRELLHEGVASLADIDTAAHVGLAWPDGPGRWLAPEGGG